VIAHELLTGKRLFDHPNDFEIITMLREMPIQPPSRWNPQVGLALDDIVMTALSRDPGLRWQSAAALRAALVNVGGELKLLPSRDGLAKWTEWAFSQQPRRDVSGLSQVIDMLGDPSDQRAITIDPEMVLTPTPTPTPTTKGERPALRKKQDSTPATTVQQKGIPRHSGVFETEGVIVGRSVLPEIHRARVRPWLLLLALLAAVGGGAYWYLLLRK
jgi:serine/threonine protein kinase